MDSAKELITQAAKKTEHIYIPTGVVTWRLPTSVVSLDRLLGGGLPGGSIIQIYGPERVGKALAVDTPIPTVDGWKSMGDLDVGDLIFDGAGNITKITFATPIMYEHKCYKVTFSNGSSIIADEEHLWEVRSYHSNRGALYGRFSESMHKYTKREQLRCIFSNPYVTTTKELSKSIIGRVYKNGGVLYNHRVTTCNGFNTEEKDLPIPPYTFGAWLGDGNSSSAVITIGNDKEILDRIAADGIPLKQRKINNDKASQYSFSTGNRSHVSTSNSVQAKLRELGVLNNKHIPMVYLRSSRKQRLDLLRGLMDTDGYVGKNGMCEFTSCNEHLASGVSELLTSLGHNNAVKKQQAKLYGRVVGDKYRIFFFAHNDELVTSLSRKNARLKPRHKDCSSLSIVSIDEAESVPVRCIQVDSSLHTYLAGKGMIPTHNTSLSYHILGESVKLGYSTVLISLEKYSEKYAQACGIDTDSPNFSVVSTDYAEYAFNLSIELIRSTDARVIVMDSIAAAVSKAAIEKKQPTEDMDRGMAIGLAARTIADFIGKLQQPIRRREAIYIFVNQLSANISKGYGPTRDLPKGGKALQYFTDIKLSLWGKDNREKKCTETTISVDKCKDWDVTPFGKTPIEIYHGKGIDRDRDLVVTCENLGIIDKKGMWYNYNSKKYQGLSSVVDEVKSNSKLRDELYEKAMTMPVVVKEGEEEDVVGEAESE